MSQNFFRLRLLVPRILKQVNIKICVELMEYSRYELDSYSLVTMSVQITTQGRGSVGLTVRQQGAKIDRSDKRLKSKCALHVITYNIPASNLLPIQPNNVEHCSYSSEAGPQELLTPFFYPQTCPWSSAANRHL